MKRERLLFTAWGITIMAMFGSLFFSEVLKVIPCELCWYQRILMYPLTLILGMIYIKKEYNHVVYVLPFCILGMLVAGYHYAIQKLSLFYEINTACGRVSCTEDYMNLFNFITIPLLSFISFVLVLICVVNLLKVNKEKNM